MRPEQNSGNVSAGEPKVRRALSVTFEVTNSINSASRVANVENKLQFVIETCDNIIILFSL